jgi:hypothetical protein
METKELESPTEEEYDEEFVKELLESSNGPSVTIDIEDLWN